MDKSRGWSQTWKHVPPRPVARLRATKEKETNPNNQTSSIHPGNGPAGACHFHNADVSPRGAPPNWSRSVSLRSGSSFRPFESRVVRPGPTIEVRQNTFNPRAALGRDAFLQELRSTLSGFSRILTAEFQVTSIDAGSIP